ncbi:NAD(P)H-binding protein [Streptomyces sp. OR43]|uniref:NAD(P)H-binding protein n=1 Tax=Streptomyces sp. or43 TaxID=2478957 RepID=UPI001C9BFBD5|nr:NAD(P)H-binding protein [Streptomyces sp. or43]
MTRRPGSLPERPGLTVAVADATDPAAVDAAVAGTDAVLSALAPRSRIATTPGTGRRG